MMLERHCERCGSALDAIRGTQPHRIIGYKSCPKCFLGYETHSTYDRKEFLRCDRCGESPCACWMGILPGPRPWMRPSDRKTPTLEFKCSCTDQYSHVFGFTGKTCSDQCCIHGSDDATALYRAERAKAENVAAAASQSTSGSIVQPMGKLPGEGDVWYLATGQDVKPFLVEPLGTAKDSDYPYIMRTMPLDPSFDRSRANRLADECQTLRDENSELLAENATLRRCVDRLERKAKK